MAQLNINEAVTGFTHSLRFSYLDLQETGWLSTGGAANQRIVGKLPAGGVVDLAMLYQVTDPAGATDLTIDFGVTDTDPDEFLDNGDVDGATKVLVNTGDAFVVTATGATVTMVGYINNTTSAKSLYMEFNGTVGDLTAGEWVLGWRQTDPSGL